MAPPNVPTAAQSIRDLSALLDGTDRLIARVRAAGAEHPALAPLLGEAPEGLEELRGALPEMLRRVEAAGRAASDLDRPLAALRDMATLLYGKAQCAGAFVAIPSAEWGPCEQVAELAHDRRALVPREPLMVMFCAPPGGVVVHALALGLSGAGATRAEALDALAATALASWAALALADESALTLDAQAAAANLRAEVVGVRPLFD